MSTSELFEIVVFVVLVFLISLSLSCTIFVGATGMTLLWYSSVGTLVGSTAIATYDRMFCPFNICREDVSYVLFVAALSSIPFLIIWLIG
jgi:hypothetical protein